MPFSLLSTRGAARFLRAALPAGLLLVIAVGCSGPQSIDPPPEAVEPPSSSEPASPSFDLVAFDSGGLFRVDEPGGERRLLIAGAEPAGFALPAPHRDALAFAFRRRDSTFLARLDLGSDEVEVLHGVSGEATFTAAWAPASPRLAFGYRSAANGDVMISTPDGLRDPNCSASTLVAHWPEPGRIVTGDDANRYVVSASDCSTHTSVDARKMHHIRYAPGRNRMAYIYRDLVYDRPSRSYVPDSALYVSDVDGSNTEELFDYAYRPRNLTWSPDGATLAFDVRPNEPPNKRRIILRGEAGEFTYLVTPDEFPDADVVRPRWSPEGGNVAFDLHRDGARSKGVRTFGRLQILDVDADSTWGWIDEETIAFVADSDSLVALSIGGSRRFALGPETQLLFARPRVLATKPRNE